jgi:hypothetical protein
MFKIKTHHVLFLLVFAFYNWLPNQNQGFDSYSYAIDIRAGVDLFHPHHLLYSYFSYLLYRIFSFAGLDCLRFLSIVNSLLAAAAVSLIFLILKSRQTLPKAIFGSLTISLIYSFWYYATSLEVNLPALFLMVLSLYWLLVKPETLSKYFYVFGFLGAAVLFHQIAVLAFIPITIYVLSQKSALKRVVLSLIPAVIIVGGTYLLIGLNQIDQRTFGDFYYWLTFYSHLGTWGKLSAADFAAGAWGIVKTFTAGETIREIVYGAHRNGLRYLYALGVMIFAVVYVLNFILSFKNGFRNMKDRAWLFLSLIAIFAIFAFWWAPTDDGFWLYPIVIMTIGIFYLSDCFSISIAAIPFLLLAINIPFEIIPASRAENSVVIRGADIFHRHGFTGDDLVFTNLIQIRLAYQYYYGIEVHTASLVYSDAENQSDASDRIKKLLKQTSPAGRIFMFENELYPEPHRRFLFERFSPQEYLQIYKPYYPYLTLIDSIPAYGKFVKIYQLSGLDISMIDGLSNR